MTPLEVMQSKLGQTETGPNQGGPVPWACQRWLSEETYDRELNEGDLEWCSASVSSCYDDAGGLYAEAIRSKVLMPDRKNYRIASLSAGDLLARIKLSVLFETVVINRGLVRTIAPGDVTPVPSGIVWFQRLPPNPKVGRIYHVELVETQTTVGQLSPELYKQLRSKEPTATANERVLLTVGGNTGPLSNSVARNVRLMSNQKIAAMAWLRKVA